MGRGQLQELGHTHPGTYLWSQWCAWPSKKQASSSPRVGFAHGSRKGANVSAVYAVVSARLFPRVQGRRSTDTNYKPHTLTTERRKIHEEIHTIGLRQLTNWSICILKRKCTKADSRVRRGVGRSGRYRMPTELPPRKMERFWRWAEAMVSQQCE